MKRRTADRIRPRSSRWVVRETFLPAFLIFFEEVGQPGIGQLLNVTSRQLGDGLSVLALSDLGELLVETSGFDVNQTNGITAVSGVETELDFCFGCVMVEKIDQDFGTDVVDTSTLEKTAVTQV